MRLTKTLIRKVFLTLIISLYSSSLTFSQLSIEAYSTVGYSSMDVEKWFGQSLEDWGQVVYGGYVQGFYSLSDELAMGAEVGYVEYFWLTRRNPFGSGIQEFHFSASRIFLLGRYHFSDNGFIEGGLGNNFFDGFSVFTVAIAAGYKIPVSDQLFIPLKIRTDFLSGESITPITLSFGVSYLLD